MTRLSNDEMADLPADTGINQPSRPKPGAGFRLRKRLLFLLFLLLPVNAYWIMLSEVVRYAGHPTTTSLFYNAIFWLCLLVAANGLVTRFAPRQALWQGELLILYFCLQLASGLTGHDTVEVLLPILSHATHYADNANNWAETLLPRLPAGLTVTQKEAVVQFYIGHSSLYRPENFSAWFAPALWWSGFLGVLCTVYLCLNVLLRRQWTERERLPFPLIALPLEMTEPRTTLFRNGLFWLGFALAVGLQLWNGIAFLYPSVPTLPLKNFDVGPQWFPKRPWSSIGWLPIGTYPFGIALGILLPTDFLFSSWFFFWFFKLQLVVSTALAWDRTPGFPYIIPQSVGAFFGVALSALYFGRKHLLLIFRYVWNDPPSDGTQDVWNDPPSDGTQDDATCPISYRTAAFGVLAGLGLIVVFFRVAGMSPVYIAAFLLMFFGIALAITRMRGELGPPVHDLHQGGPDSLLPGMLGPNAFDRQTLTAFGLMYGLNRAYRGHAMPIQLEAMATTVRGSLGKRYDRVLFGLLLVCGFVGPMVAFWALLHLGYENGAASAAIGPPNVLTIFGNEAWGRYKTQISVPQPPQPGVMGAVGFGCAVTLLLNVLRTRVVGFPLHPVGYAVASSWGMSVLWVPMLIAWVIKALVLRYGGLPLYRRLLPFCYGILLGDCVAGSLWSLLSMISNLPMYAFWP